MHRLAWLVLATAVALVAGDVNADLLEAARQGDLAAVKALLAKGGDLETKTAYGQTPLYLAAMQGHPEVVEFLLSKGANTDVHDTFYKASVLDFVLERKHYDVAKLLIAKSSTSVDKLLPDVAGSGNVEMVKLVLDKGKPSQAVLDKAYAGALEGKETAVADVLRKAGADEPAAALQVDPKVLESYVGTYKTENFPLDIKVSVKEGKLVMQATGQPEFVPKATSPTVFEFAPANIVIEFDSPTSFTLKQGGMNLKFKKG